MVKSYTEFMESYYDALNNPEDDIDLTVMWQEAIAHMAEAAGVEEDVVYAAIDQIYDWEVDHLIHEVLEPLVEDWWHWSKWDPPAPHLGMDHERNRMPAQLARISEVGDGEWLLRGIRKSLPSFPELIPEEKKRVINTLDSF